VADLDPNKKRIVKLFRMLGSSGSERRNAFAALERAMQGEGVGWSDMGNVIERGFGGDDGKYTEAELQEFGQALRAEGVEAGIKIGLARTGNGSGDGHYTLPNSAKMAEYCNGRLARLKDDAQRTFISKMHAITQRGRTPPLGELGYLASIYIKNGGRI
jgi:hypothetical protein